MVGKRCWPRAVLTDPEVLLPGSFLSATESCQRLSGACGLRAPPPACPSAGPVSAGPASQKPTSSRPPAGSLPPNPVSEQAGTFIAPTADRRPVETASAMSLFSGQGSLSLVRSTRHRPRLHAGTSASQWRLLLMSGKCLSPLSLKGLFIFTLTQGRPAGGKLPQYLSEEVSTPFTFEGNLLVADCGFFFSILPAVCGRGFR